MSKREFKIGDHIACGCMLGRCRGASVTGEIVEVMLSAGVVENIVVSYGNGLFMHDVKPCGVVSPAPPVSVAPTLETATGAELDRIAADIGAVPRLHCESDASFRLSTVQYAAWKQRTADVVRALQPPDPGVTQAEWSAAIARINAQHKALDTVRRFLGSHSFASCSLACNRELREVMAVVLAALDAERAGK